MAPKTYLFNRNCLLFNKEVFKFLQLFSETSEKFRSSIFTYKTLTVDPDSNWKPEKKVQEIKKKVSKKKVQDSEEVGKKVKNDKDSARKTKKVTKKKKKLDDSLPQA
jgi:hypothetical protein